MRVEISNQLGHGSAILTLSIGGANKAGWFDFINANAPGLAVLVSIFFGVISLGFLIRGALKERQADANSKEIERLKSSLDDAQKKISTISDRKKD